MKTNLPLRARLYDIAHTLVRAQLIALLFFLTAGVFTFWAAWNRDFPLSDELATLFTGMLGRELEILVAWDGVSGEDMVPLAEMPSGSYLFCSRWIPFMLAYSAALGVLLTFLMRFFPGVFRKRWKYFVYGAVLAVAGIGVPFALEGIRTVRAEIDTGPIRRASGSDVVLALCWNSSWRFSKKLILFPAGPGGASSRRAPIPFPGSVFIPDTPHPETVWRIPIPPWEMERLLVELEVAGFFRKPSYPGWWDHDAPFDFLGLRTPAGSHSLFRYGWEDPEMQYLLDLALARAGEYGDLGAWQKGAVSGLLERIRGSESEEEASRAGFALVELILPADTEEEDFLTELGAEAHCDNPLWESESTIRSCFERWALSNLETFDPKKTRFHSETACRTWLAVRARNEARASGRR